MLKQGLYEQILYRELIDQIASGDWEYNKIEQLSSEEIPRTVARHFAEVVERVLVSIKETERDARSKQIQFANRILNAVAIEARDNKLEKFLLDYDAKQLLELRDAAFGNGIGLTHESVRPETSISESSLFTGAHNEPSLATEFKKEILSCDRIDMLVSFVKWSGLLTILNELRTFVNMGGRLRVITTSYMGATDVKAIEALSQLPNTEIKISYDTKRTRLHAKTYIFHRDTGFTTAYIGSSNLTNVAISNGLEWNIKATKKDLPYTIDKVTATFESYWKSSEFEEYTPDDNERFAAAIRAERRQSQYRDVSHLFHVHPYPYQEEILDKLLAERELHNRNRNLVVAATGTGKTVISAFDYRRYAEKHPGRLNRLLFIAHRKEILEQSMDCFRGVLRDENFGELMVASQRPARLEHLFLSIQTFNSQFFHMQTTPDFYDFIVIDEFHHAQAKSYQKLLSYYEPKILLGLTATPERMDGKDVTAYFDNRIAAEIRLPEAIERRLLCPFFYYGVTDSVDLDTLKWANGGYDRSELSNLYTLKEAVAKRRAALIVESLKRYVADIVDIKALGFCVSKEHARFMAEYFNACGLPSIALDADSDSTLRDQAKRKLVQHEIQFIFVVDIYNEGVDIPEVNTILFLRPTESLTVFLQQLGRGLRLSKDKEGLVVLDFIGQANKRYNFADKYAALLSRTGRGLLKEMREGFSAVPKGCYIQLEKKASEYILNNIRQALGRRDGLIDRIATFEEDSHRPLLVSEFISYYHTEPKAVYKFSSFSKLCVEAAVRDEFTEPLEEHLGKFLYTISDIDSPRWIRFLLRLLNALDDVQWTEFTVLEKRFYHMFLYSVWPLEADSIRKKSFRHVCNELRQNPILIGELINFLNDRLDRIDLIRKPIDEINDCPIDIHGTYNRNQIMVAFDYFNPQSVREGVKYLPDLKTDLLFVTLEKNEKQFKTTNLYDDYAIDESHFHWQSQSTTSEDSETGRRYINQKKNGNKVLLFVRQAKNDENGKTLPYTCLGFVDYIEHSGSKPMSILWKMQEPIPAKYLRTTNPLL